MSVRTSKGTGIQGTRRNVPIATVAARAGVSIATVSRVVNGVEKRASAETVERVRQAVAELGYRPMSAGRSLRQRQSRLVALLAANLANPAMAAIAAAAETAFREAGLIMVLCDTHDRADLQDEYLLEMRAHLARATVLLGAVDSPQLSALREAGEPLLFVNRRCPGAPEAPFVGIDNLAAGVAVARHLLERGRRPLAVIHGPLFSSATAERVAGFCALTREAGVALATLAPADAVVHDHLAIGYRGMDQLIAGGTVPAGLFCTSDLIAFGAHRRATEAGLRVPDQLAIVGFDNNPLNDWVAPWLPSVEVPYGSFGAAILATVEEMLAGRQPTSRILPYRLVQR